MTAPCAVCGRTVPGEEHVEVEVERVPPEEPPRTFYFHTWCFDQTCGSWERGV